jgi:hypothetical protein
MTANGRYRLDTDVYHKSPRRLERGEGKIVEMPPMLTGVHMHSSTYINHNMFGQNDPAWFSTPSFFSSFLQQSCLAFSL